MTSISLNHCCIFIKMANLRSHITLAEIDRVDIKLLAMLGVIPGYV